MRRTIEFSFDLSMIFLRAVVAILVFLSGAREHILALWGLILTFYKKISPVPILVSFWACLGDQIWVQRHVRIIMNKYSNYNRVLALQARKSRTPRGAVQYLDRHSLGVRSVCFWKCQELVDTAPSNVRKVLREFLEALSRQTVLSAGMLCETGLLMLYMRLSYVIFLFFFIFLVTEWEWNRRAGAMVAERDEFLHFKHFPQWGPGCL